MRTENEIKNELDAQLELYRANVDNWTRQEIDESNKKVKALQAEWNDFYIQGAIIPDEVKSYINGGLHGMRRGNGQFEIGCSIRVLRLGKTVIQGVCSRGATREEAVNNWNNGIYVN